MNSLLTAADFFSWLAHNSKQASLVVVLVLLAQFIFKKRLSPQWRSALWLLVIVRLLWPLPLESPVSVYNVLPAPSSSAPAEISTSPLTSAPAPQTTLRVHAAKIIWLTGAGALLAIISFNTFSISRKIRRERPVTDTAILELLEDCKTEMRVHTPLTLIETRHTAAPLLYGFVRPRLLLPPGLTQNFSRDELRHIFLHELAHLKRADIPLNWLAAILLVLHWFNPLIWFAFARMRLDREFACDALALSLNHPHHNTRYGETIIRLIENFSRPAWAPGIVGIVEDKHQIKRRIQMIAQYTNRKTWRALAVALFAALGAITLTEAQSDKKPAAAAPNDGSPRIVKTSPAVGAKDVDPATKEITITFDRDMASGFSWTGGPPDFPPGRDGQKPTWKDKRTCTLPVALESAKYYRVGINSTSHQNFRSADGIPAKPSAIYFTTKGASAELQQKTTVPKIVKITPENGATDVDPKTSELRVTFNVPMGGGFSWTGGGPSFPPSPAGKRATWSDDKKTCILPVELQPGAAYTLGLNSESHKNFQSAGGVPLEPVVYTFKTK